MQIDDDELFDPRLRWARENSEDLSSLVFEKKKFDLDMRILSFIAEKPSTAKEIAAHFEIADNEARNHIKSLRRRGVVFMTERDKAFDCLVYAIRTRPDRIKFFYPKTVNKFK